MKQIKVAVYVWVIAYDVANNIGPKRAAIAQAVKI